MHFSPKAVEKIAIPVDTAWTIPPASALASSVTSKLKNNKVSHMDDQRGRYDISVLIMNSCFLSSPCPKKKNSEAIKTAKVDSVANLRRSKGSSLVLKEATEKENLESGGDSSPINNAKVDGPGFGDVFGDSEDLLKDETKDFVKPACELDFTDDVVFGCDEGTDPMLKKMKGIVKPAFEFDSTGFVGSVLKEGPDSKIGSSFEKSKADVSTKDYHHGDGLLVLKEATKKENPESGGDSAHPIRDIVVKPSNGISINNAKVGDTEFGGAFGRSGLALKEEVKDETKGTVKTALELDDTGDVVFGFEEVTDLMLKDATENLNDAFELDGTADVGFGSEEVETFVDSDETKGLSIKSGGADALAAAEGVVPRSGNMVNYFLLSSVQLLLGSDT